MEDILIFSKTVEEQLERLEFVFQRLRQHGLKWKLSKCHFFKIRYLGHFISQNGIKTNPDKTKSIQDWKIPTAEKNSDHSYYYAVTIGSLFQSLVR